MTMTNQMESLRNTQKPNQKICVPNNILKDKNKLDSYKSSILEK